MTNKRASSPFLSAQVGAEFKSAQGGESSVWYAGVYGQAIALSIGWDPSEEITSVDVAIATMDVQAARASIGGGR